MDTPVNPTFPLFIVLLFYQGIHLYGLANMMKSLNFLFSIPAQLKGKSLNMQNERLMDFSSVRILLMVSVISITPI